MAAILQLRRGAISDFSDYGTNISEPYFDTGRDTIHIGTTNSTGSSADWITLAKLSQANYDSTKDEPNSGSFWLTGNYTGSNMILSDNIIVSGSGFIEGDLHLEGHLYLGSGSDGDIVKIQSEFSGSLVPDNDLTGSTTPTATTAHFDLGSDTKRWRNTYLQRDVNSGSLGGALSGSNIDLTGQIKVDELGRFGYVEVDDLVDNRIVIVGPSGRLESDSNLTYDGQDFRLTNSDYYQSGSGASWQFVGAGGEVTGSWTISELAVDNGIVFTNAEGTLDNQNEFTWDGGTLYVDGNISGSGTLRIDGQSTLASLNVEDLTDNRILIAGTNGEIEDDQYFTYDGDKFEIGSDGHFTVLRASGNTFVSGAVQLYSTLNVDGQSTLASVNVEDLTDNRVVIVGAGGEIEDDGNFTFNGTELNIGTGNFTVQQGSGNTQILGTLNVDSQSTLASLNVEDLTSGRIVLVGTSGELEDSGKFTFDQNTNTLTVQGDTNITGNTTISGDLTVSGTTTQLDVTNLNVEDKNILIASGSSNATAANGAGITIDGADATILYGSSDDSITINKQLKINGNISGSSFGGTTLLSSSNENFADYSQSVDSRLDTIEGPMSTSLDSRLIEIFSTGSDHETRLDELLDYASGSGFTTGSTEYEELTLQRLDGTSQLFDLSPRRVRETIINKDSVTIQKGMPVYVSGSTGNASHVYLADASNPNRMPATYIADQTLDPDDEGRGLLNGFIVGVDTTQFNPGDEVWVSAGGGYQNTRPTGSNILVQKLGNVIDSAVNGSGVIFGAGRSNDVPNIQEGYLWVGNGDDVATQYTTSSLIPQGTVSGSDQVTSSLDSRYVQSGSITGSNVVGSDSITSIETMTSASYAAITPVSGTLYIIVD